MRLLASLIILVVAILLFLNRQFVIDQFAVLTYQPTQAIDSLVSKTSMTDKGKFYFFASQPEIDERDSFNRHCQSAGEQTAVLGCYTAKRIYIFDVTDNRLNGIKEVTAAHEMLHAAYDRLSDSEKSKVNMLIEQQLKVTNDPLLQAKVALYDKIEPGERLNELHSIFGTEVASLSPDLEKYYSQYFSNRSQIVKLSAGYEQVFTSIKAQQDQLISDLNALAVSINERTTEYNAEAQKLSQDVNNFNNRANTYTSQAQFDADRNELVARQNSLEQKRTQITDDITLYNQKKQQLDDLNGQAERLNQSINSNLNPTPAVQ